MSTSWCDDRSLPWLMIVIASFFIALAFQSSVFEAISEPVTTTLSVERAPNFNATAAGDSLESLLARASDLENVPKLAWIMSIGGSGTSYTLANLEQLSQTTTATNYGGDNDPCLPVHAGLENGPFWHRPDHDRPPQDSFLAVKTHCGGYCIECGPHAYLHTGESFETACTTGNKRGEDGSHQAVTYDSALVQRAVHLIRNPFDNIVARMHLANRHGGESSCSTAESTNQQCFDDWCQDLDTVYAAEEEESPIQHMLRYQFMDLPCHAEWFRYVQWHNRAYEVTRQRLGVDVHYLHYENYTDNFDETVQELLRFLQLPVRDPEPHPFVTGKTYGDIYREDEARRAAQFVRHLALPPVWNLLKHYFQDEWLLEEPVGAIEQDFEYPTVLTEVTWLMSFPNSGTSYTMNTVEQASNASVASNYAADFQPRVSVRPGLINGPYLHRPELGFPVSRTLTKTHCAGYCASCPPNSFVLNLNSFMLGCQTSIVRDDTGNKVTTFYEPTVPSAVVHLFRSPFDNLVARFHFAQKTRPQDDPVHNMSSTKDAFYAWCEAMQQPYLAVMRSSTWMSPVAKGYMDLVPCFSDLYRYIQWHNLALETTDRLQLPVHYLYYEDYTTSFNATLESVFDFLGLEQVAEPAQFVPGKAYGTYYEPEEARIMTRMVQDLASEELWAHLQRYFVD